MIHDNAQLHVAGATWERIDSFEWEVFDHPCTGPDFSPSVYQLFSKLKEFLAGVCLDRDEELVHNQQVVKKQNTTENFYDKGIKKLVSSLLL